MVNKLRRKLAEMSDALVEAIVTNTLGSGLGLGSRSVSMSGSGSVLASGSGLWLELRSYWSKLSPESRRALVHKAMSEGRLAIGSSTGASQ